jgi:hypothetical protein
MKDWSSISNLKHTAPLFPVEPKVPSLTLQIWIDFGFNLEDNFLLMNTAK